MQAEIKTRLTQSMGESKKPIITCKFRFILNIPFMLCEIKKIIIIVYKRYVKQCKNQLNGLLNDIR